MTRNGKKKGASRRGYRHLSPAEVLAIAGARARGVPVARLAKEHGVCRQTIYNAIRDVRTGRIAPPPDGCPTGRRRRRVQRIPEGTKRGIVELKVKYPRWGAEYLRDEWVRLGHEPVSVSSIYKILRDAGVNRPKEARDARYTRFEMTRPGQLYQMDIQGKTFLENVGWIHGFAVIDDFSRFVPAMRYFAEETTSNAVLVLHEAVERHGIPEALYVDNGTQFRSRGSKMNNFELLCSALGIRLVAQSPYRPQGKGKIERFFLTEDKQFLSWAREKAREDPQYGLSELNRDLQSWLSRYNARVHGGTRERPSDRFAGGSLPPPDPPVDVARFLERSHERRVNKFGEVSFHGSKVDVDLPARSRVTVVETLETLRIEYGGRLVREVDKCELSRRGAVARQDGVRPREVDAREPVSGASAAGGVPRRRRFGKDERGYYHRRLYKNGNLKVGGVTYYVGMDLAPRDVLVKVVGNAVHVFDASGELLRKLDKRAGRRY